MKNIAKWISLFLLLSLLTGCLYPQERRQQLDQLPEHIMRVQSAVDAYQKNNKVLPYKYTEDDMKLTTKYMVDFQVLQSEIPPTAFEKGGNFLYVIIDVEKRPTVRVFDLRVNDAISKIQPQVYQYVKTKDQIPGKEQVGKGVYTLAYDQLGIDPIDIPSPYDPTTTLPILVDSKGKLYLDYRTEAMKMIQKTAKKPEENQDLRVWLGQESLFVPGFAYPMVYKKGEPVFVSPSHN